MSLVPQSHRPVLPRRAWQAHVQKLPAKPKVKKEKPDEKPWPRNFQIAAGVAACVFIPYTGVWLITSNPTLRDTFGPFLPMERLRRHFGTLEWDAQSHADKDEEIPTGFYQYPLEDSFRDRQQQKKIEESLEQNVTANIYVLGDSQAKETKQVPASISANSQNLGKIVGATGGPRIAVEFADDDDNTDQVADDQPVFDEPPAGENTKTGDLLRQMHTFSTWHYTPAVGEEAQQGGNQKATDTDIDRMRLEYAVEKLQKDLRDPNCTRDHDEMRAELKEAKSDLSRLKWKRRLGF